MSASKLVRLSSGIIIACVPEVEGTLLGDEVGATVFGSSKKIKRFVPGFCAKTGFAVGVRRTIAWFAAGPARQKIDGATSRRSDKLVAAYESALVQAKTTSARA